MIVLMGVAGSGKSVQGKLLADKLALPWLSTGEFLRMLIAGEQRKDMVNGKLIEDDEIIRLMQKVFTMIDVEEEFVLDGFPRTAGQADWLLNQVKHGQLGISAVINLIASEDTVRDRLIKRGRADDYEDAINERFREYEQSIKPILGEFKKSSIPVFDVNAEDTIESIHKRILESVQGVLK
jgi:adenylate kinase